MHTYNHIDQYGMKGLIVVDQLPREVYYLHSNYDQYIMYVYINVV